MRKYKFVSFFKLWRLNFNPSLELLIVYLPDGWRMEGDFIDIPYSKYIMLTVYITYVHTHIHLFPSSASEVAWRE